MRRLLLCIALGAVTPSLLAAQSLTMTPPRIASISVGGGNSFGWWGVQAEKYLAGSRVSVFGSVGRDGDLTHLSRSDNFSFAAGTRVYTNGLKHRLFGELSVSEIVAEGSIFRYGQITRTPRYGPGLQAGYQFVNSHGLTLTASAGYGYALGMSSVSSVRPGQVLAGFSIGYTLR